MEWTWLASTFIRLIGMGLLNYAGVLALAVVGIMSVIYSKEVKRLDLRVENLKKAKDKAIDELKEENKLNHKDIWKNIDKTLEKGEDRKDEIMDLMKDKFHDIQNIVEKNEVKLGSIDGDVRNLGSKLIRFETIREISK